MRGLLATRGGVCARGLRGTSVAHRLDGRRRARAERCGRRGRKENRSGGIRARRTRARLCHRGACVGRRRGGDAARGTCPRGYAHARIVARLARATTELAEAQKALDDAKAQEQALGASRATLDRDAEEFEQRIASRASACSGVELPDHPRARGGPGHRSAIAGDAGAAALRRCAHGFPRRARPRRRRRRRDHVGGPPREEPAPSARRRSGPVPRALPRCLDEGAARRGSRPRLGRLAARGALGRGGLGSLPRRTRRRGHAARRFSGAIAHGRSAVHSSGKNFRAFAFNTLPLSFHSPPVPARPL